MKKIKFLSFVFISICLVQSVLSQPVGTDFDVIKEQTKNNEGNGHADPRFSDLIVPINNVTNTIEWNDITCLFDPDIDITSRYATNGFTGNKDVNKLRVLPYTTNQASSNPSIDNHTFWFTFGCCGINTFCADDFKTTYVHDSNQFPNSTTSPEGKLLLKNVETSHETSVWINFMTQCEDCTTTNSPQGNGVWYKWEQEFMTGELDSATDNFFPGFVDPEIISVVPCNASSIYGCGFNELSN